MKHYPLIIVGAGPAGLSAAIEAAKAGVKVLIIDENHRPGGQMFKQIHKFFGSRQHHAGVRGYEIGQMLLEEAMQLQMEFWLNSEVLGIENGHILWVTRDKSRTGQVYGECIILATGAVENALAFPGWELPGVMNAGAAQTMINIHRVLPGKRIVMIGSGNVGVIVSYQLMQAGADVAAIVEAAPKLSGYGVHIAKVRRAGVPLYVSHTVKRVLGTDHVEAVELVQLDERFRPIEGTELIVEADTVCVAVGFTPLIELAASAGCQLSYCRPMGGHIPAHCRTMQTSLPHLFIAGDISGVEEASTAMEEGRLAGIHAAARLGVIGQERAEARSAEIWASLDALRSGQFGQRRHDWKEQLITEGEVLLKCAKKA
ncbi:MAG: NAD(P)/FAD-dependent oxidoreductase [Vescimonas sp.]